MKKFIYILSFVGLIFSQSYDVLLSIENDSGSGFDLRMHNPNDAVGGFQIQFESGTTITGASGGSAATAGFTMSPAGTIVLAFSFSGSTIPAGNEILFSATYSGNPPVIKILADNTATTISNALGTDYLIPDQLVTGGNSLACGSSDLDLCGNCYFDSSHFLYTDGFTYVEGSACTGCTDAEATNYDPTATQTCDGTNGGISCEVNGENCCCASAADIVGCTTESACNYNADATVDDGSCWTANDGCTCSDAQGAVVDCAGQCGGAATLDCNSVCSDQSEWIGDQGVSNGVDECGVCGGTGKDSCGECPGDDGLYGYSGSQLLLGGYNSTCTGCMDAGATNFNSTAGDPVQSSNLCSGDGCTIACPDLDGDELPDCCFYSPPETLSFDIALTRIDTVIARSTEIDLDLITALKDIEIDSSMVGTVIIDSNLSDTVSVTNEYIGQTFGTALSLDSTKIGSTMIDTTTGVYVKIKDNTAVPGYTEILLRAWDLGDGTSISLQTDILEYTYLLNGPSFDIGNLSQSYVTSSLDSVTINLTAYTSSGSYTHQIGVILKETDTANSIDPSIVDQYSLLSNYPNPFNSSTTIQYSIAKPGNVSISIYSLLGHLVYELVNDYHSAGINYRINWDSDVQSNEPLPSGIYLYVLKSANTVQVNKMLLIK